MTAAYKPGTVAVLTPRPGRLKALLEVNLPRPRSLHALVSKDFMKLKRTCMDLLREEMLGIPASVRNPEGGCEMSDGVSLEEPADVSA